MRIVVTAGPTREYLDPVRFLSNPSTGKMGFAIAAEAAKRGHDVTLIAGPVSLPTPKNVKRIDVVSAREMLSAVTSSLFPPPSSLSPLTSSLLAPRSSLIPPPSSLLAPRSSLSPLTSSLLPPRSSLLAPRSSLSPLTSTLFPLPSSLLAPRSSLSALISTAAVADWRPAKYAAKKLKKTEMSGTLRLVRNPDILKTISKLSKLSKPPKPPKPPKPSKPPKLSKPAKPSKPSKPSKPLTLIGFAAETNDVLEEAARKCREKGLAFIVANDVTQKGSGFGTNTNKVTFVFPDGTMKTFPLMTKRRVAVEILKELEQ